MSTPVTSTERLRGMLPKGPALALAAAKAFYGEWSVARAGLCARVAYETAITSALKDEVIEFLRLIVADGRVDCANLNPANNEGLDEIIDALNVCIENERADLALDAETARDVSDGAKIEWLGCDVRLARLLALRTAAEVRP